MLLLTAVNLATPMLVGTVFNQVFPERNWPLLWWILVGLLGLFLLRNLFFYQSKFTAVRVGENVCFTLRKRLFERIQQLRLSYTRSQSPGQITSKVMNDSMQIQQFIADVLPKALQAGLLFLGIILITYSINWQLALASTFILPVHLYVFGYFGRRIKRSSRESQERIDFATGSIFETVGIQLAVRPRINEEGQEVSMQVNATVSAVVPNEDVEVRDSSGDRVVAVAPTISIREVKTYARIANNTPFIIGGLIAKDDLRIKRSVPILGSIPYLGRAFGNEQVNQLKREVIIVITPFVLPEEVNSQTEALDKIVGRFLPKGEDTFDSFGNELFRDAYRIRDEDVFELNFLIENAQLNQLQARAERAVDQDYALRAQYPFSSFANGRVPGENILVYRQMYEVIKRIRMDERVDSARSLVFEPKAESDEGFEVSFLEKLLIERAQAHAGSGTAKRINTLEDVWAYFEDKALTITYRDYGTTEDLSQALESPVPAIEIVEVADRAAYEQLFWELNQPDAEGRLRHSIILHDEDDLRRLKRAIVLRDTVTLNAVDRTLTLDNFSVGRFLLLPTRDANKVDLVDGQVAKLFFLTERYYDALRQALRQASSDLEAELKTKGIK